MSRYGTWVKIRAQTIAYTTGLDPEDVFQSIMMAAWVAASDPDYDPALGKTAIGFVYQRVVWSILNFYNKRGNADISLSDLPPFSMGDAEGREQSDTFVVDHYEAENTSKGYGLGLDIAEGDVMRGSREMTRTEDHVIAKQLIEQVIELVQTLPSEFSEPIIEILAPSKQFERFAEDHKTANEAGYANAARYEICGVSDLEEFTGAGASMVMNIEATVRWLRKKIPELNEL